MVRTPTTRSSAASGMAAALRQPVPAREGKLVVGLGQPADPDGGAGAGRLGRREVGVEADDDAASVGAGASRGGPGRSPPLSSSSSHRPRLVRSARGWARPG